MVLLTLAGRGALASRVLWPAALLVAILPANAYEDVIAHVRAERHPVRTSATVCCGFDPGAAGRDARRRASTTRSARNPGFSTPTSIICVT
jgi:hypothetical protein